MWYKEINMPGGRPRKYSTPEEAAEAKKISDREYLTRWKNRNKGDMDNWSKLFSTLERIESKVENMRNNT